MKRFNFSLEKVLELRVFEQDQAQNELGKANAEVARIQRELGEELGVSVLVHRRRGTVLRLDQPHV